MSSEFLASSGKNFHGRSILNHTLVLCGTVSWVKISWFASQPRKPRKFYPPKNTHYTVYCADEQQNTLYAATSWWQFLFFLILFALPWSFHFLSQLVWEGEGGREGERGRESEGEGVMEGERVRVRGRWREGG